MNIHWFAAGSKKSPRSSSRRSDGPESSALVTVPGLVDPVETVLKHLSMGLVGRNVKDLVGTDEACEEMARDGQSIC